MSQLDKGGNMKIYWEIDTDEAKRGKRVETLIRENGNGTYTILGTAQTQKEYDNLTG